MRCRSSHKPSNTTVFELSSSLSLRNVRSCLCVCTCVYVDVQVQRLSSVVESLEAALELRQQRLEAAQTAAELATEQVGIAAPVVSHDADPVSVQHSACTTFGSHRCDCV